MTDREDKGGESAPVKTSACITNAARGPELCRRAMLASTSAVAFGAAMPSDAACHVRDVAAILSDEGTQWCKRWLAMNADIECLQARWDRVETWLVKEHAWFELSQAEREALPWAEELRDLDRHMETAFVRRDDLMKTIASSGCVSMTSVIARLAVVEQLLSPFDDPDVHALIAGARRDLILISETSRMI